MSQFNEYEFKVGDKIKRVTSCEHYGAEEKEFMMVGAEYTVERLDGPFHIYVHGFDQPYSSGNFKLVRRKPILSEEVNEFINIPEKPQYNFLESEMNATFDCDDTLVMWDIGGNQPYDMWAYTEQEKCKPEDVVRIEDPYKVGEAYYLVKHNRHIKLLQDYKARGFGVIVWSAGGSQWAKAVVEALGIGNSVDLVMAKPNRHVDDMPCTSWMGERIFIPRDKH